MIDLSMAVPTEAVATSTEPAKPVVKERDHADVGSSSIGDIAGCPGWKRDKRPRPPHPVTESGSRCHEALEKGSIEGLDEIEVQLVEMCEDYLDTIGAGSWAKRFQEERLYVNEDSMLFGYFDVVGMRDAAHTKADLVDFKFGWGAVEDAEKNWQGKFLAVGAFAKWPTLEEITVHFLQPRLNVVTRHTFTRRKDLDRLQLELLHVVARMRLYQETRDESMLRPSFNHCRYCGSKATCPVMIGIASKAITNKRDSSITVPDITDVKAINDPVTLSQIRDLVEIVGEWADAAKWHILQKRTQEGIEIPGWKVVEKSGVRRISDSLTTYRKALEFGITAEEFAASSSLSVGKLEEFVRAHALPREKSKRAKQFIQELIDADAIEIPAETEYLKRE